MLKSYCICSCLNEYQGHDLYLTDTDFESWSHCIHM